MSPLPAPPQYAPYQRGRYVTSPDLHPFGADLGGGTHDAHLFQIDREFFDYHTHKRRVHARRFLVDDFNPETRAVVVALFRQRLLQEHPERFTDDGDRLHCRITGETLTFDPHDGLADDGGAGYADAFDALCCQVQEDVAVVRRTPERGDWNAALHVCAPSHWAPEAKIGRSFSDAHAPVPGMDASRRNATRLVDALIRRGPFVRFTWGITFDPGLDQHPERPPVAFDGSRFWLRVERQTLWPLPEVDAFLFTIRVFVTDGAAVCAAREHAAALASALRSMSPEAVRYKGVEDSRAALLAALESSSSGS